MKRLSDALGIDHPVVFGSWFGMTEASAQIASFNILECADLDEALEVASKNPGASFGTLELRPFAD